jgi:hypothetical protein
MQTEYVQVDVKIVVGLGSMKILSGAEQQTMPMQRPHAERAPGEWWKNMLEVFHLD